MTDTEIRDALLEVGRAVDVPVPDEIALRQQVRVLRRRRLAGRGLAAAATVAAVTLGVGLVIRPAGSPPVSPAAPVPAPATSVGIAPVAVQGTLEVLLPDGSSYDKGLRVEEVLGRGPAGVVVIGRNSHLLLVPLDATGEPGTPRDLGDGDPVQRAWLDKSGEFLAFVDLGDRLHLRSVGSDRDREPPVQLTPGQRLLAADADHWVVADGDSAMVHGPAGTHRVQATEPASSVEIGGSTLAYRTDAGVSFFDLASDAHRSEGVGLSIGSLSPDGGRYAAAAGEQQRDSGASPDWYVVDTRTGERDVFEGRPPGAVAQEMTWQDDDRFLVLATDPRQPGNLVAWDCSVALQRCVERYNDVFGTMSIASE